MPEEAVASSEAGSAVGGEAAANPELPQATESTQAPVEGSRTTPPAAEETLSSRPERAQKAPSEVAIPVGKGPAKAAASKPVAAPVATAKICAWPGSHKGRC